MHTEPHPHDAPATAHGPAPEGFASGLLTGRFDFAAIHPFPAPRASQLTEDLALTTSASCVALSKRCLKLARVAAEENGPDGLAIGKHGAFAEKLARLAGETFAVEAMTLYAASLAPGDPAPALRMEAAMTQLWATARSREHELAATQIQHARESGATPMPSGSGNPVAVRDSSESTRLRVGRAVFERHWRMVGPVLDSSSPGKTRLEAGERAAWHYVRWYPRQWLGPFADFGLLFSDLSPRLAAHVRWSARTSHRLSRALFHALVLHGAQLDHEELLLGRLVDLGTELFAITAACSYAQHLHTPESLELADFFARATRLKIERLFQALHHHADRAGERLAHSVLAGRHTWLEGGD